MKNKNLLLTFLTSLLSLVLIVPMFLNIFGYKWTLGDNVLYENTYGIFADYSAIQKLYSDFSGLWSVVFNILMIVGLVLAGIYLITFLLELLNVKKINYKKVKSVIGLGFAVVFVLALVSAILFMVTNHYKGEYLNYQLNIIPQVGFYVTVATLLVSAVMAFITAGGSNKKTAKKGAKKRK